MDFVGRVLKATLFAESFWYDGRFRTIRILPGDFEPRLPACVGYIGHDTVFMSDYVPPLFRKPVAIHEFCCVPCVGTPGHCKNAILAEIGYVPKPLRLMYLAFRRRFFDSLLDFYRNKPPPYYGELEVARAELDRLQLSGALFSIPYIG